MLRRNTPLPIRPITVGGRGRTKESRIESVSKLFPEVRVPFDAPWVGKAFSQILSYPRGKDDIVMALAHGLRELVPGVKAGGPPPRFKVTVSGWEHFESVR